jgi:gamma-D-glutamyl-L-lysine dipeptidyl-peptidase
MKRIRFALLPALMFAGMVCGCSSLNDGASKPEAPELNPAERAIQSVKEKYAPDDRTAIFTVGLQHRGRELVLTGDVVQAQARIDVVQAVENAGVKAVNRIQVLPAEQLGAEVWGIASLSVANGREQPGHKAEMGTQVLMGEVMRVWKRSTNAIFPWYLVQAPDGYVAWMEGGAFVHCTREQVDAWNRAPLLIVTAFEDRILEQPRADAQPVSDVVMCDRVKRIGEEGDWYKVELPDGRTGYLPRKAAADFNTWKQSRRPTADNIERTARSFMGRPYFWGGYSTKGYDCSGFAEQVFFINGIDLIHSAASQARQGQPVPLDGDLGHLKKGDLLFFGHRARRGKPERVTHVAIYLGDKLFIQSSLRVRINSLDPASPLHDDYRIDSLLSARRVLPE